MRNRAIAVMALTLLATAGWQAAAADRDTWRPASRMQAVNPTLAQARVTTRDSSYGSVLVNGRGRTIYLFDREERSRSESHRACARAWPPLLTRGRPIAAGAASQALLGSIERRNGARQVTYSGHPLYLYADEDPGEILCQEVFEFGGTWLLVDPEGDAVR